MKAKPFVKWVGGKTQLIDQLEALLPADFDQWENVTYIEPFVGRGAMLIRISRRNLDKNLHISEKSRNFAVKNKNKEFYMTILDENLRTVYEAENKPISHVRVTSCRVKIPSNLQTQPHVAN